MGELVLSSDLTEEQRIAVQRIQYRKAELQKEIEEIKDEISRVQASIDAIDREEAGAIESSDDAESKRARMLRIGIKKFNMDFKDGMKYLFENSLVEQTPRATAEFFLNPEHPLGKTPIGEYLGEKKDFNINVLSEFVMLQDFANLNYESALRQYLSTFRLPGEAQKIERCMEKFAEQFYTSEKEKQGEDKIFNSEDTVFVLAFSTIMLNTDLHNESVKKHMTLQEFINNNRGINDGENFPEAFLTQLYDNIKSKEIAMPKNEDGNDISIAFFNPEREGWLTKQGGRRKNWKKRWFILTGNCLYYFKDPSDSEPCGIIPLENLGVREVANKRPFCFEIYNPYDGTIKACKTLSDGQVVEGRHSVYLIAAADDVERSDWLNSIGASIRKDPFYSILSKRKSRYRPARGGKGGEKAGEKPGAK